LGFYVYFLVRAFFTPYTPLLYNTKFLNISLLVILYFIIEEINNSLKSHSIVTQLPQNYHSRKTEDRSREQKLFFELPTSDSGLLTSIIIHFLIITGFIQAVWGLLQLYGITKSFHSGFKITGTFFNPAPYALYLATIFPLALGTLLQMKDLKNVSDKSGVGSQKAEDKIKYSSDFGPRSSVFKGKSHYFRYFSYYISFVTVISIILVLPATMNRASWVGAAAGSFLVFNYRYKLLDRAKAFLNNTGRKLFAIVIIVVLIGLSGAGLFYLKKGSSTGKLLIWEVTLGKIIEKPLFGHGIGRFEAEYNNWQAEYFKFHPDEMDGPKGIAAGNTKYCFNEYLEMAAELGLIGFLLFLGIIPSIFYGIKKRLMTTNDDRMPNDAKQMTPAGQMTAQPNDYRMTRESQMTINDGRRPNDAKQMTPAGQMTAQPNNNSLIPSFFNSFIIIIPSLISLLVMALISFPFYSLPTQIVFFLLLAILSSCVEGIHLSGRLKILPGIQFFTRVSTLQLFNPSTRSTLSTHSTSSTPSTFSTLSTVLILSTVSVFLLFTVRQQYKAYFTMDEAVKLYQIGIYNEACQSFSKVYDPMRYNGSYLQYYGKALCLNEEYSKSIEMLKHAVLFTSDEILYTTLGDTYKALKRYSEAEEAYLHASFMVPHKLYPLYLLARLYDETGQNEKAVSVANKIMEKEIKVESEATEEIRAAMMEIIRKSRDRKLESK
jgi:O-antigen ligase